MQMHQRIADASIMAGIELLKGLIFHFGLLPTIKELGRTRMEVNVKVKSVFGAKMFALGVVIKTPVPKQTAKKSFQVTSGRAKYNAATDCIVWNTFTSVEWVRNITKAGSYEIRRYKYWNGAGR